MIVSTVKDNIFLLTGLRIYTGEYKAQGPTEGSNGRNHKSRLIWL